MKVPLILLETTYFLAVIVDVVLDDVFVVVFIVLYDIAANILSSGSQ